MKKIQTIIIAAIAAAFQATAIVLPEIEPIEGYDLCGYVHDGTSGIAGVQVTDGYSIVLTDDSGLYRIASNPKAGYVYISTPSGYAPATVENAIQGYWAVIDPSATSFRHDFELKAIGDDSNFHFLVHADPQPTPSVTDNCWSELGKAYSEIIQEADKLNKEDGFETLMLMLGDITEEIGYIDYLHVLNTTKYNVPTYPVPGNHDKAYLADQEKSTERYRSVWGPLYYSFNRGNVHFVMLDNVGVVAGDYYRGYSPEEYLWVQKDLALLDPQTRVILCGHIAYTNSASDRKSYEQLLNLFTPFNTLILSGHSHFINNIGSTFHENLEERNQQALSGHRWRGKISRDGTPNGYYIYNVVGSEISWAFKATGKNIDKCLFRMYEPGQFDEQPPLPTDDKTVIINVYDWDPYWTVTWRLDDVEQGEVGHYEKAYDPMAQFNYDSLPSESNRARQSKHMFYCEVPSSGSHVEVTATDRFGRTMTSSLYLEAGVESINAESCGVISTEIFNLAGISLMTVEGKPYPSTLPIQPGCYLLHMKMADGSTVTEKAFL